MIRHEPWYKSAIDTDLRRLEEEAQRGDPEAIRQLRTLQERSNQPLHGEDVSTPEEMLALLQEADKHGFIPFYTRDLSWMARNLDMKAMDLWFSFILTHAMDFFQKSSPQREKALLWFLRESDRDWDSLKGYAPGGFMESLWLNLEKKLQKGEMKDPYVVEWMFRHEHPHEGMPKIPIQTVLLAPDSVLPQVAFNETNYYSQEGWDHWDESEVGEQVWPLREFYNTFKDLAWDTGRPSSESAKGWALRGKETHSEIEEGDEEGVSQVEQTVVNFPKESENFLRWLHEVWEL